MKIWIIESVKNEFVTKTCSPTIVGLPLLSKFPLFLLLFLLLFSPQIRGHSISSTGCFFSPDSLPPDPPGEALTLTGPASACVGETCVYEVDVPVACTCQWSVNNVIQPVTSSSFEITWAQAGTMTVSVVFVCSGGQYSDPQSIQVMVMYQPVVSLGNDTTILQGQALILDAGNPGSDYLWSTGATTQTIQVSTTGTYWVDVHNFCGEASDTITVSVIVGIYECGAIPDCFTILVKNKKVGLGNIPADAVRVQLISMNGETAYDGEPVDRLLVPGSGIYFIRIITNETTCTKKVFIP